MAARVFMSYSHQDEALRNELEVQLTMLKRQGLVEVWHDRRLTAGDHLDETIDREMDSADIILLLVSPDFLASDYCYEIETSRALQRHQEGTARAISVILRPCDWKHAPLARYVVTPTDGRPVTEWPNRDAAFLDIAQSIRRAIQELGRDGLAPDEERSESSALPSGRQQELLIVRSSNLRLRKEFTKADEDRFLLEAFEFLDRFFQGSLQELELRNSEIETRHRRVDGNCFTATIYKNGEKMAGCTIRLGGFGDGITYSDTDAGQGNSYNDSLSVEKDDQKLFLKPVMNTWGFDWDEDQRNLSQEGAAEYYWARLIQRLQGD